MHNVGDVIAGEYAVLHAFTNGGMGIVYKVRRHGWDLDMAMKCPRAELFENDAQRTAFIRECETWMDLGAHPNIISCYYVKTIGSVPTVFMEYADGGTLHDLVLSGRLYVGSPAEVLRRIIDVSIQVARGLAHAHREGYVHQDVKPANVLVTATGVIKVSDFGLSKAKGVFRNSAFTVDGRSLVVSSGGWTPAYGSPEQALGRPLTKRTDIWSWAVMVLEMIHGSVFWNGGPFASQALKKLWPWQIFSSKVKSSGGLVNLLRECLEEREDQRPKDFDVIEVKLLGIYRAALGEDYPRRLPASVLMAEASMINRIASYAELESHGREYFDEVYRCISELHAISPWAIWGDWNFAAYLHAAGLPISDLYPIIDNLLPNVRGVSDKCWLLDVLMSFGVCSPRNALIARLLDGGGEALRRRVYARYKIFRQKLHNLFDCALTSAAGIVKEQLDSRSRVFRSENGMVEVEASVKEGDSGNCDLNLSVKTANGRFQLVDEGFPSGICVSWITVDNNAQRISVWICAHSGWYQKKYALGKGGIVSYRCDFREASKWGSPSSVYISGDARFMMVYYGHGKCSVWLNQLGGLGDGRNICDLNLFDFGLIPPDSVLPGLVFESGYEYGMSPEIAYPLMRMLAAQFGVGRLPCRIVRPESSSSELRRSHVISDLLEDAKCALLAKDNERLAKVLGCCLELGALPDEKLMAIRHRHAALFDGSCPTACWRSVTIDEYWESPIQTICSFEPDRFQLPSIGYRPRCLRVPDNKHGTGDCLWNYVPNKNQKGTSDGYCMTIAGCENNDAIFGCYQDGSLKWLRRISGSTQECHRIVWECPLSGGTGIELFRSLQQTTSLIAFTIDEKRIVSMSKRTGSVAVQDFGEYIDFWKMDFEDSSPLSFLAVTKSRIKAIGEGGVAISDDQPICRFARQFELTDVSSNGRIALGRDCWGGIRMCDLRTGETNVLYGCDPFDSASQPCWGKGGAVLSRSGRAAVVVTGNEMLRFYDVVHRRQIFSWKLVGCGSVGFDWSERWVAAVQDQKKIAVFQLFWEAGSGGGGTAA